MVQNHKLVFPKIRRVKLYNFSLYSLEPNIDVQISEGVFCLAGANGLGKSTFLAAVNFAITGIVGDPNREFKSVDEYYKYTSSYYDSFFTGRISEEDRDSAEISVHLEIAGSVYQLTRGVFEPNELREFKITNIRADEVIFDGLEETAGHREQEYRKRITADIGLNSFQQFVFLQHFVFTFDESRHLLLWDQRALNQAIFLSIGTDYEKAEMADKLRREMEAADSLARNYSWQASAVRSEIDVIQKALSIPESEVEIQELGSQHETLQNELEQYQNDVEYKISELNEIQLKWIEASSELNSLQQSYENEFSSYIHRRSRVDLHPVIANTLAEAKCVICGSTEANVVATIQRKIDDNKCPLCENEIPRQSTDSNSMSRLKEIDQLIRKAKNNLDIISKSRGRVSTELQVVEDIRKAKLIELREFEKTNEELLYHLKSGSTSIEAKLQKKIEEMNTLLNRKDSKYKERDRKKIEYLKLQRELEQNYIAAQEEFVPLFRDLAFLFLGIDLDIRMDFSTSIKSPGVSLTLELRGIVRKKDQQLSESQRFFLDIALRMALSSYMSAQSSEACLFIDTPEGSLDIAYESRVGQMFAQYLNMGHDIIMTANINSSQILLRLALECGRSKMTLHQMTSWTELSDVQLKEQPLFQNALAAIEEAFESSKK